MNRTGRQDQSAESSQSNSGSAHRRHAVSARPCASAMPALAAISGPSPSPAPHLDHADDPPLQPPRDDPDLGAGEQVPDLAGHRGRGAGGDGAAGHRAGDGGEGGARARQLQCRAHRRDRARDPARRHRLPDQPGRVCRARGALRAPGHDLVRRAGHHAVDPAVPGDRPADRRCRRAAGGAAAAGGGAPAHPDRRPQPRHPCRADHLRPEAGRPLGRLPPQPRPAGAGAARDRHLRHLRPGRHLRLGRPLRRALCRRQAGPGGRAGVDPGDPARPPRHGVLGARRRRLLDRAPRHRDPAPAAHRGARGGGVLPPGPEGLVGDAAQAQPGADREPDRPGPAGARRGGAGAGECGAVA